MADFDFSTLVTDRSASDLELLRDLLSTPMSDWTAEQLAAFNQAISKGAYNYTDLNRVTACMDYLNKVLTGLGYVTGYQPIIVHPEEPPAPVGPLPEGYTQLEYIESTGTQYIDTGFKPNQDTRVVMQAQLIGTSPFPTLFGSRNHNTEMFWFYNNGNNAENSTFIAKVNTETNSITGSFGSNQKIDLGPNYVSIDDTTVNIVSGSFQCDYGLYMFAANNQGTPQYPCKMNLYSCQIYDDGILVRDYIPCENPTGEIGLYDLVNDTFYENSGTGVFTAGPEIVYPDPPIPLDPYTWYEEDTPTASLMSAYLANVESMRAAISLPDTTPVVPSDMDGLTLAEANAIEEILDVLNTYLLALEAVFLRSGMAWAVSGGPGFYFVN